MYFDLSGLHKYQNRIDKLEKADLKELVSEKVESEATPILNSYYSHDTVYSYTTPYGFRLVCIGNGLWFREFGTGIVGKGTFPDNSKLPKTVLTFFGRFGQAWMTSGWQYEYHPLTQKYHFWYTPTGGRNYGQVAQAGFYKTSLWIKHNCGQLAKETIREVIE